MHVRALRMSEHTRGPIAACRVVSAGDHAGHVRRREVPEAMRVLIGRHRWRGHVVGNRTIRHHGRWYGHRRVIVGTWRRRRVVAVSGRIDIAGLRRLFLIVRPSGMHRVDLTYFAPSSGEQAQDDWIRGVGFRGTLARRVRGISPFGTNATISPNAYPTVYGPSCRAPLSKRIRTTSTWPFFTASMRGVTPV